MEKKKYVDYVTLIAVYGLTREFNLYCRKHRGISLRRNARNFLLKNGKYEELRSFRKVGFEAGSLEEVIKIAKTPWLGN